MHFGPKKKTRQWWSNFGQHFVPVVKNLSRKPVRFFFGHDEFTTVRHILIPDIRVRKRGRLIVPEICRKNNMFPRSVFLNLYFLAKIYVANNANRKMHYSWDPIKIERKTTIKIQFQKWDPILIHFRGGAPS